MEISIIINKSQLQIIQNIINKNKLTKTQKQEIQLISEMIQDIIDQDITQDTEFDFT